MKRKQFFLVASALLFGLTACNSRDDIHNPEDVRGNTHMSITLSFPSDGLRAEDQDNNGIGEWEGADKINSVDIYMTNGNAVEYKSVAVPTELTDNSDQTYTVAPWSTTPGQKVIYVAINLPAGSAIKTALDAARDAASLKAAFEAAYSMMDATTKDVDATLASYTGGKDIILMTGKSAETEIKPGITEAVAGAGTENRVNVEVRRNFSRVLTTFGGTLTGTGTSTAGRTFEIKKDGILQATLSDIKWYVGQYEKTSYLLPLNGEITVDKVKSPHFDFTAVNNDDFINETATSEPNKYYTYVGTRATAAKDLPITPATKDVASLTTADMLGAMKFITETTHQKGGKIGTTPETGYRRGNTTYVMVTATCEPAPASLATGETYTKGNDLYYSRTTGKFYGNKTNAETASTDPDAAGSKDGVITYKGGKMYYFVWVDPDTNDPKTWTFSPVIRNNIYHINVTAFLKFGFSGNPYNPDPNNPDPDDPDPDDPTPDPDDPIYDEDTYMSAKITVMKWGVHSFDITL